MSLMISFDSIAIKNNAKAILFRNIQFFSTSVQDVVWTASTSFKFLLAHHLTKVPVGPPFSPAVWT